MHWAPLLGEAPSAYALWKALQAQHAPSPAAPQASAPALAALIHAAEGKAEPTVSSCQREGAEPILINTPADLTALDLARFDWVMPMRSGDALAKGAGDAYRAAALKADESVSVIYADDDAISDGRETHTPHLKPDWNSELFQHHDYISGAAMLRAGSVTLRDLKAEGSWSDWVGALTRQALDEGERAGAAPVHIHRVLHHRRTRPAPSLPLRPLDRPKPKRPFPSVSVIIPTRNRLDLLSVCLKGLIETDYPGMMDILITDNGSDDPETVKYLSALDEDFARVMREDGPFNFAALNNRAAKRASSELLCFLNNDIEITDPHWLSTLVLQAMRDEVGAVGPQLVYPDGRIQHAGVVIGIGGGAAHAHRGLNPEEEGYFHRHALPQFVSALTAACLVVRRDRFDAVGGFDEERFAVSFNDVDLCLKLRKKGWHSLYEPRARMVHHESVSRGFDRDTQGAARLAREVAALQDSWNTGLANGSANREGVAPDPYHHPGLSRLSERFTLRLERF